MIEGRKRIEERMSLVLVAVRLGHVIDDRFGILDHMTVAVDNRMAFKWHRRFLLLCCYLGHQDEAFLSRLHRRFG